MHQTRRWNGFRTAVVALGIAALAASNADAAALISYTTVGSTIDSTGVTGPGAISLNPVTSGLFSNQSAFSLGEFQVADLHEGTSTTYKDTPFHFTFQMKTINGTEPVPNGTPIVINGLLNGTINGSTGSSVVATFDPASIPNFKTGLHDNTLSIPDMSLSLVPFTSNGGRTTAQAKLVTTAVGGQPIPEPTTIALFLTTLAGLGIRHRVRAGRVA